LRQVRRARPPVARQKVAFLLMPQDVARREPLLAGRLEPVDAAARRLAASSESRRVQQAAWLVTNREQRVPSLEPLARVRWALELLERLAAPEERSDAAQREQPPVPSKQKVVPEAQRQTGAAQREQLDVLEASRVQPARLKLAQLDATLGALPEQQAVALPVPLASPEQPVWRGACAPPSRRSLSLLFPSARRPRRRHRLPPGR